MNLTNYYWYFKSAIPVNICDDIIKYSLTKNESIETMDDNKKLTEDEIRD